VDLGGLPVFGMLMVDVGEIKERLEVWCCCLSAEYFLERVESPTHGEILISEISLCM